MYTIATEMGRLEEYVELYVLYVQLFYKSFGVTTLLK